MTRSFESRVPVTVVHSSFWAEKTRFFAVFLKVGRYLIDARYKLDQYRFSERLDGSVASVLAPETSRRQRGLGLDSRAQPTWNWGFSFVAFGDRSLRSPRLLRSRFCQGLASSALVNCLTRLREIIGATSYESAGSALFDWLYRLGAFQLWIFRTPHGIESHLSHGRMRSRVGFFESRVAD